MNVSQKVEKAITYVTLATSSLLGGCVATLPPALKNVANTPLIFNPNTVDDRMSNARQAPDRIMYETNGSPVRPTYRACDQLRTSLRAAGMPQRDIDRAAKQGLSFVVNDLRGGRDITNSGTAGVVNLAGAFAISWLNKAISDPVIKQHDANCTQERAYEDWKKENDRASKEAVRNNSAEFRYNQQELTKCTASVQKEISQATGLPKGFTVARRECLDTLRPN